MAFSKALSGGLRKALREARMTDRAMRLLDFDPDRPLFHATRSEIEGDALRPSTRGSLGPGVYAYTEPFSASRLAQRGGDGGAVMPLVSRGRFASGSEFARAADETGSFERAAEMLAAKGYAGVRDGGVVNVFDAKNLRSKFAKFNPLQSEAASLLAGGALSVSSLELLRRALAAKMDGESSAV